MIHNSVRLAQCELPSANTHTQYASLVLENMCLSDLMEVEVPLFF